MQSALCDQRGASRRGNLSSSPRVGRRRGTPSKTPVPPSCGGGCASCVSLVRAGLDDVVNLQDHLAHLQAAAGCPAMLRGDAHTAWVVGSCRRPPSREGRSPHPQPATLTAAPRQPPGTQYCPSPVQSLDPPGPHLRGQEQLLLLADQRLKHMLLPHVVGARLVAVNAQVGVALLLHPGACAWGG